MTQELWKLSATDLAAQTRGGNVSAEDAVASAISRMNDTNPDLNAVVMDLSDQAMARARDLDKARASGAACGPLHGVPVTIKVNVDQTGWATTNGIPALKDAVAAEDAPLVAHLQNAGAVVIGRTNTPEFSFRADTDNPLHGRTHNPWGRHVSAGGSSGGAGSAVMAGIGALAHGNDIGGSLRFPAVANGAVTVKPGLGRVPAWNPSQKAERGMLAQSMSVQGLITRHAKDLHLSMPTMMQPDVRDPYHVPLPYHGEAGPLPTVGACREVPGFDVHPEVLAAIDKAEAALRDAGYTVVEIATPPVKETADMGYRALMGEVEAMMGPDIRALGSETINNIFAEYFAMYPPYEGKEQLVSMAQRTYYAREWARILAETPLILSPFQPTPFFAPNRDAEGYEGALEALGTGMWSFSMNFIGQPSGIVPTHIADLPQGRQPMSVQIIGARWREDRIVDALCAVEDRVGAMCHPLWEQMAAGS